ncbi:MAG: hypothetical protein VR69_14205 [Peptococcaceae bacterium BRH_c4b]|nr:MAG: hypothetical protein VR69_14205 [Peptococcaceae bacterium BRH_c4b]
MSEEKEFNLELSEEAIRKLEDYANRTGQSEEQVVEYILYEFLEKQYRIVEKRAEELNRPVGELMAMQFVKILEMLESKITH